MNVNNINPQSVFGGSWEKVEGRFLLGSSTTYLLGTQGGEASHTLTLSEMPSHNHNFSSGQSTTFTWAESGIWIGNGTYTTINFASISNTGGNQPHNNLPPYLVVNIWKRVA